MIVIDNEILSSYVHSILNTRTFINVGMFYDGNVARVGLEPTILCLTDKYFNLKIYFMML